MEAPYLSPRVFLRNFTTSPISTAPSVSSSPTAQSTSISTSPTSHSSTFMTSSPTSQSTSLTTGSSRTIPPTSSFSSSILSTSTTSSPTPLSTSTSSFSPTPTVLPSPTPKPTPPPSTHNTSNIPLYTGIALSLFTLLALIFFLLRLEAYLHRRRQRSKLLSSIPLNPHEGLRTLHLPQVLQHRHQNHTKNKTDKKGNRRSRQEFSDGRRFGVVGLGLDDAGEGTEVQSEEMGRRNREHFEAWKRKRGFSDVRDEGISEESREESSGRGMGRERRETFDAWKRGVVPPIREDGSAEGSDARRQRQVVDDDAPTTGQGSSV